MSPAARRPRAWLVNPYGTLPGEGWREYRNTKLGRALAAAGYDVTWWIADFEHRAKASRSAGPAIVPIAPGFAARVVPSAPYHRHISLRRIRFEQRFARNFARLSRREPPADVIVLAEPALFTSGPVRRVARALGARIVVDVIDLWPDVFRVALPPGVRRADRILFAPLYARRARLMRDAAGLIAVAPSYLALAEGLATARGGASPPAAVVYWGLDLGAFDTERNAQLADGVDELEHRILGRPRRRGERIAVYAGTLGDAYDVTLVLAAAARLRDTPVTFVLAGAGPLAAEVQRRIADEKLDNCIFVGALSPDALAGLLAVADIGLATYKAASTVASPIKVFDYFAAGVPIVSSLRGDLEQLITTEQVGVNYAAEDAQSLTAAVRALLQDDALRARLGANARALAERFDDASQYQIAISVVNEVLQRPAPRDLADRERPGADLRRQ